MVLKILFLQKGRIFLFSGRNSGRKMLQRVGNTAAAVQYTKRQEKVRKTTFFMLFLELALSPMILLSISEELSFNRQYAISDFNKKIGLGD
jgi:hypothetical protein